MLARARSSAENTAISYLRADLENVELPAERFDLVYSSLAFHYIEDLDGLLSRAAMPEFRPYATMQQKDVDDCGKDTTSKDGKKGFAVFSD